MAEEVRGGGAARGALLVEEVSGSEYCTPRWTRLGRLVVAPLRHTHCTLESTRQGLRGGCVSCGYVPSQPHEYLTVVLIEREEGRGDCGVLGEN